MQLQLNACAIAIVSVRTLSPVLHPRLIFAAAGGDITFTTAECASTNLCNLAMDVEGIKAKFVQP